MPAALAVPLLPKAVLHYGLAAPFMIMAALGVLVFWLHRYFPENAEAKTKGSAVAGSRRSVLLGVIGLVGIFIFYGGQSAVWAFVERIGIAAGLTGQVVGNAIFLALLAGIGGGLLAAALGTRSDASCLCLRPWCFRQRLSLSWRRNRPCSFIRLQSWCSTGSGSIARRF